MTLWLLVLSYRRRVGAKTIKLVACVVVAWNCNGLRKERGAREKHAREEGAPALSGETPMKFVSRPLCSLRNRRLGQLLPSACCRLQIVAAQHGGFVGSSTERRSRKNARERLAVPPPLHAFARPTKTATLRWLTKPGSSDTDCKNIFLICSPGLKFTIIFLCSRILSRITEKHVLVKSLKVCMTDVESILKLFLPKLQQIIMSCSCLIFLGIFVGQSTDSWLTVFSWP